MPILPEVIFTRVDCPWEKLSEIDNLILNWVKATFAEMDGEGSDDLVQRISAKIDIENEVGGIERFEKFKKMLLELLMVETE